MNKTIKYLNKLSSLEDKIYIVTGANSGLGYETSLNLAIKKAKVIMACRNISKAQRAKEKILNIVPDAQIDIVKYDQSSFESIDKFAIYIEENYNHIDGLVCNAGVYFPKADYKTIDNLELTIGTNYFGVYYLLKRMNLFLERCSSRVVMVTSLTGFLADKSVDLIDSSKLSRGKIYGYSKYCLSRLCNELSNQNTKVKYYLTHPGICSTNIISSDQTGLPNWFSKLGHLFLYIFVHSASKASLTNLVALTSDDSVNRFIKPRGLFAISGYPIKKKFPTYCKDNIIEETENYLKSLKLI
jgi:NAD(P)-dependent dehydrogenase (short-subunit alcohol dehydrogenase family)